MNKFLFILISFGALTGFGAAPKVGRLAAARYFQNEKNSERSSRSPSQEGRGRGGGESGLDHFMSVGFGTFSNSAAYNWGGKGKEDTVGDWGVDLSYRFGEEDYLFDQLFKVSYNQFTPAHLQVSKLSFMYAISFPETRSQFPLYFGAAVGPGVFIKQLPDESVLTLDYQLYLGLRAFNLFGAMGLYIEGGLRNHLNLTSDGQFNGTFLSVGSVFVF